MTAGASPWPPAALRHAQATAGPVATAGAHFVLSLFLLHALAPATFGRIAFLLVLAQLAAGLWSALFCAPLPVLLARAGADRVRDCMLAANLAAASLAAAAFLAIAAATGLPWRDALLFALYAAAFLLRWFARADAYAAGRPLSVLASDATHGMVLLAGVAVLWTLPLPALTPACALLLAGALAGLLPFGRGYLAAQFHRIALDDLRAYAAVWRAHARWALAGVVTTEATTNAHAYLLTFVLGPAAFAPVAASALLARPIGVVVNALTEFERPNVARLLGRGDADAALGALRVFHRTLALAWLASAGVAVLVLLCMPTLVFPASYDLRFLSMGTGLWLAVALVRQWRAPESVLLQAAGAFRVLAHASMVSALVSGAAVAAFLWLGGALWSIGGILLGEAVCTAWIRHEAHRYRRRPPAPGGTAPATALRGGRTVFQHRRHEP